MSSWAAVVPIGSKNPMCGRGPRSRTFWERMLCDSRRPAVFGIAFRSVLAWLLASPYFLAPCRRRRIRYLSRCLPAKDKANKIRFLRFASSPLSLRNSAHFPRVERLAMGRPWGCWRIKQIVLASGSINSLNPNSIEDKAVECGIEALPTLHLCTAELIRISSTKQAAEQAVHAARN